MQKPFIAVLLWRIKAPKGPQMSHMAKLRSEHSPIIPFTLFFQQKGGPQRPPFVTERAYFVHKRAICTIFAIFLTVRESCTHFSLAFTRRPGATPLLGRRLRAGRTFASPFWNFQNRWSFWRLRVRLGRPLASAGWEGVALAALPVPDQQLHNA